MATTQVTEQILDLLEALRGCVQECVVDIAGNYVGHGPSGQVYIDNEYGTSRGSDC